MNLALLCVVVLVSYMVNATTGFGGAMIAVTVGIHLYSIELLVPIMVLLNLAISIYIVIRHHDGIDYRLLLRRMLPLAGLGLRAPSTVLETVEPLASGCWFASAR